MHYIVASVGTVGDALPYLRICQELRKQGHTVEMFVNQEHQSRCEDAGIEYVCAGDELKYTETISNPSMWHQTKGIFVFWRGMLAPTIVPLYRLIQSRISSYGTQQVYVVANPFLMGARLAQEHLGARLCAAYTSPAMIRTYTAPSSMAHIRWPSWIPSALIKALWKNADARHLNPLVYSHLTRACEQLGIEPPNNRISLYGDWLHSTRFGVTLYPAWFRKPRTDHPRQIQMGAFPITAQSHHAGQLQPELLSFLKAGPAPVVVTFGTGMRHAKSLFDRWNQALQKANARAIFVSASTEQIPSNLPSTILGVRHAEFDLLLPHSKALIHHGGIGSCAQAIAAGIAQIMQPHAHDQFENLRCAQESGIAMGLHRDASVSEMTEALKNLDHTRWQIALKTYQRSLKNDNLEKIVHLIINDSLV